MTKEFLRECQILKTNQYDAFDIWEELKVGAEIHLVTDGDKDIAVQYWVIKDKKVEKQYTVGILKEEDANVVDKFVRLKWAEDVFDCFLSKSDKDADESKRFNVAIFVKMNGNAIEGGKPKAPEGERQG